MRTQRGQVTLMSNLINPTRGETTKLHYTLKKDGYVTITVFDLKGDIVEMLYRGRRNVGEYSTTWDGKNRGGRIVARGVYFIKVVAPGINEIRKVLVVK
jgi:flagellar hook assembly protein FlgD